MIEREVQGEIATLRLAHGKVSALDLELLEALDEALRAEADGPARALVLTGTGSTFSAGVDLFRVLDGGRTYIEPFLDALERTCERLFALPKPVVAAINGHAIAGGCVLACAADYRVLARGKARIGIPELEVGVPFPPMPLEIMRFATPVASLQKVVYLAETFAPDKALELGLVDEVCDADGFLGRAVSVAGELATIPAVSYARTKEQLRRPALERAHASRGSAGAAIVDAWCSESVLGTIRSYMDSLRRR